MPTINNPILTLTETNGKVDVSVRYDVTFSGVERQLKPLGLDYHTHVSVHGMDGTTVGPALPDVDFPRHSFDAELTVGNDEQTLRGVVEGPIHVPRFRLQEDPAGDPDELVCLVRVHSPLPPLFSDDVFTPQRVLSSS